MNVFRYHLVVVAVVFFNTVAAGTPSIQWSGPQDVRIEYDPEVGVKFTSLDGNGDGVSDLVFTDPHPFYVTPQSGVQCLPGPYDAGTYFGQSTPEWISGTTIELTSILTPLVGLTDGGSVSPSASAWGDVQDRFLGFSINIDGSDHYGWLRMSVWGPDYQNQGADNYAILHDWAYETQPGVGIIAGAVPEPSTWTLFLIGATCIISRFRSRRKA